MTAALRLTTDVVSLQRCPVKDAWNQRLLRIHHTLDRNLDAMFV